MKRKQTKSIKRNKPNKQSNDNNTKFQATYLFLTWPQNETDKQVIHDRLLQQYPDIEWMVVSNENHEPTEDDPTGGIHSHVILKLKKRKWIYHRDLDAIAGNHGNYQTKKGSNLDAINYVIKHGNYITYGFKCFEKQLKAMGAKQNPKAEVCYEMIKQGQSLKEICDDAVIGPFAMMNLQKLEHFESRYNVWRTEETIKYGLYDNFSTEMNEFSRDLFDYLEYELTTYPRGKRPTKRKQAWIHGDSNLGKTWLKKQLMRRYKCFMVGSKDPLKGYHNFKYDILIIDEPRVGQYQCETLNKILEGGPYSIEERYTDSIKLDNPLVIVLTNHTPDRFYPNISEFGGTKTYHAFLSRIIEFETTLAKPIRIWKDPEDIPT